MENLNKYRAIHPDNLMGFLQEINDRLSEIDNRLDKLESPPQRMRMAGVEVVVPQETPTTPKHRGRPKGSKK